MDIKTLLNTKAYGSVSEGKHTWKITSIEVKESEKGAYIAVAGTVDGTEQSYFKNLYSEIDINNFISALIDLNPTFAGKSVADLFKHTVTKNTEITMWLIPSGDFINIRYREPYTPKEVEGTERA